jgi:N-acetylmuramoyl-L-alanine amidase
MWRAAPFLGDAIVTFTVKSHRLQRDGVQVPFHATPNRGGAITPEVIVLHDTAGRLDHEGSVRWLCDKAAKASAHFVVGRDGAVTQLAQTNIATWHAGQSSYRGKANVNGFSVGIEIVNPGIMQRGAAGKARAWFGQEFEIAAYGIEAKSTPEHGSGLWMPYTEAQIQAVIGICAALVATYPTIADVTTHWAISPGRKVDTNPLFPLEQVRSRALGRQDAPASGRFGDAVTTAGVNLRRWPSLADNVIAVLPKGTRVRTIRSGVYQNAGESARWFLVEAPSAGEGWVHGAYLALDR